MLKQPISTTLFVVLAVISASCPMVTVAQTNHVSAPLKLDELLGKRVENTDGVELGTVRNLVLDTRTGQLKYVILGSGGFLGLGTKLKIAPPQVMSAATAKRETLAINVTREHWRAAPKFNSTQLASLAQSDRADQIAHFYAGAGSDAQLAQNTSDQTLTATGARSGSRIEHPELKFASDLVGERVINRDGEKIGEVRDLLVAFDGRPVFAIISSGRLFRNHEHRYAVPLRALGKTKDGEKLILNADSATLQKAPLFSPSAWEHGGGAEIYLYGEGSPRTALNPLRRFFGHSTQPTNEKDSYGKMQFIGESPVERTAGSV